MRSYRTAAQPNPIALNQRICLTNSRTVASYILLGSVTCTALGFRAAWLGYVFLRQGLAEMEDCHEIGKSLGRRASTPNCIREAIRPMVEVLEGRMLLDGQVSFAPQVDYETGYGAYPVRTADLNGDGNIDLVTANRGSDTVSVLLCRGDGTFAPKADYATGHGAWSVTAADLNGDGKNDLAATNFFDNTVSVLLNNGDGTFGAKTDYAAGNGPESVTAADLNGDGKIDLAVADYYDGGSNSVSVLLNRGDGTFTLKTSFSAGSSPRCITAADFNGDGRIDLAVAHPGSSVSVLLNTGNAAFASPVHYTATSGETRGLAAGDFNRDGRPDLVTANGPSNTISVLLNRGDGTFPTKSEYPTGAFPFSATPGDFNGDGWTDLATGNRDDGTVTVLLNRGDGTFGSRTDQTAGSDPWSVAAADFNGDHKTDLAASHSNGGVSVLLNTTSDQPMYIVNSLADTLAADGVLTLREAIQAANTNAAVNEARAGSSTVPDIIGFDPTLFASGPARIRLGGGELSVTGALAIKGPGSALLSIDADRRSRVFNVAQSGSLHVEAATISGGNWFPYGGGVYNAGTLDLNDVTVSGSGSIDGGGIYNAASAGLSLTDAVLSGNEAGNCGGGLCNLGSATLTNVSLLNNKGNYGGGGVCNRSAGTARRSTAARPWETPTAPSTSNRARRPFPMSPFSGNSSNSSGGGMLNAGVLTLRDSTITANTAQHGAGLSNSGTLTIDTVTISENSTNGFGGGVWNVAGSITLTNSNVSDNSAGFGGGINNARGGTMTITGTTVSDNTATAYYGGGILNNAGTVTMANVTIRDNSAPVGSGGGVCNQATMTIVNATISGNASFSQGAGIDNSGGSATLTLTNGTIRGNGGGGCGLYSQAVLRMQNTIVAGNFANADFAGLASEGSDYNLFGVLFPGSSVGPHSIYGSSIAPLDAKLGELTEVNGRLVYPLLAGSPAIDAGSSELAVDADGQPLTTDAMGGNRIVVSVDIGAVEGVLPAIPATVYVVESLADDVAADGILTLREALEAATQNRPVGDAPAGSFAERDRITFAPGLSGVFSVTGSPLVIRGNLAIEGPGASLISIRGRWEDARTPGGHSGRPAPERFAGYRRSRRRGEPRYPHACECGDRRQSHHWFWRWAL